MTFGPQANYDGSPNRNAVFRNCVLIEALYRQDRPTIEAYARIAGAEVKDYQSNPNTYQPDYAVLTQGDDALVVFAGTTNAAQWVGHCASAYFPLIDSDNGNSVVGQFYLGLNIVEPAVTAAVRPEIRRNVYLTGHSYGAGALKIFADHLSGISHPPRVSLLTFGEPKSTGNFLGVAPSYEHMRIVGKSPLRHPADDPFGLDPVTFCPPGVLQLFKFALTIAIPLSFLGLKWKHFGSAWGLSDRGLSLVTAYDNLLVTFDPTGWVNIVENLQFESLHLIDTYLSNALALFES